MPSPYTSSGSLVFDSWDEVAAYTVEDCEDGITIEDFGDACVGIEMPEKRCRGFIKQVDGSAGISCEALERIARYKND